MQQEVKEVSKNPELTEKQRLFVAEYLTDFNATRAYLKAYKCTYETAMVEGWKSLRNPKIQSELKKQTEAVFDSTIGLIFIGTLKIMLRNVFKNIYTIFICSTTFIFRSTTNKIMYLFNSNVTIE